MVIGTTRKPTQRIRSFVKELVRVIPRSFKLTRGKQSLNEFCHEAQSHGASRILLVGAYHGNPGRLGFLHYSKETWQFQPPTILLKSITLLRESHKQPSRIGKKLYVVPDTPRDLPYAGSLANALDVPIIQREALPLSGANTVLCQVALQQQRQLSFISLDGSQLMGPTLSVKRFLNKAMGDMKRW